MICIEDFTYNAILFELNFQKDKEYNIVETKDGEYVVIGIFNVPFDRVKNKFKEA